MGPFSSASCSERYGRAPTMRAPCAFSSWRTQMPASSEKCGPGGRDCLAIPLGWRAVGLCNDGRCEQEQNNPPAARYWSGVMDTPITFCPSRET